MFKTLSLSFIIVTIVLMSGCASVASVKQRQSVLDTLAYEQNLTLSYIPTSYFTLASLEPKKCDSKVMRVYIEGDGLSWISRSRISDNPTPLNPLAAKLMNLDASECKVYLARPCQYVVDAKCKQEYWINKRFSKEIIQTYTQALNSLKDRYKINSFVLVGYSGGGAIATLSATQRDDVSKLITIAGNLDIEKWVKIHNISPLEGSLNPADFSQKLQNIEQIHLVGTKDKVIPKEVFLSYKKRFTNQDNIKIYEADATHQKGWQKEYQQFLLEEIK